MKGSSKSKKLCCNFLFFTHQYVCIYSSVIRVCIFVRFGDFSIQKSDYTHIRKHIHKSRADSLARLKICTQREAASQFRDSIPGRRRPSRDAAPELGRRQRLRHTHTSNPTLWRLHGLQHQMFKWLCVCVWLRDNKQYANLLPLYRQRNRGIQWLCVWGFCLFVFNGIILNELCAVWVLNSCWLKWPHWIRR